ncbi:unnamed protein product [Brassica oleracea var. botrytis]
MENLSQVLPRVLVVSRRTVRKNKFVDFVGEYHLDLIVRYGCVPVIVPRVTGVHMLLESFKPIHGVLLCEGEDIDPSLYESEISSLSPEELQEIRETHASDTSIDREKDSIELALAKLCLEQNIPYLGICRGSQILNVACDGTLYLDLEKELTNKLPEERRTRHIDYDNYDEHRHVVRIVENSPLHSWFKDSLDGENMEILVNSYHHQGVKKLAQRFVPMAFASDGLIEGFYDPDTYNPEEGKFIMGLQFHPERMRSNDLDEFDYPGCPAAYQEFAKAVIAYQKKLSSSMSVPKTLVLDGEMESKRKILVRCFSLARYMYTKGATGKNPSKVSELEVGAEFLESNTALSTEQETRLKEMGATKRELYSDINQSVMFSPILFGFSNPNSCLILIFFSFYFHHLPCALSQPDLKFCDNLFHCGNITAGFPFWGEARPEPCGHPSLGLHCHQNSNKTYFIFSGQMYSVLFLDNSTNTLGLARQDFLGVSFCNSTLTGTTLTNELFQLSPEYTTLFVYYLCEPHLTNPANFKCPKIGIASLHRSNENHKKCSASFNITVPTSYAPEIKSLNLARLQSVLRKGFEVKLRIDGRPCQECKSTGGVCGYDVGTPVCCKRNSSSKIKCNRMIPSVDEHHKKCHPSFTCANQRGLSYPFWIPGRKECGHPDFKVNCNGDVAEFSISSVKFQILENKGYSIILAIKDYQSNLCPRHPENVKINPDVLPFSQDHMLSIFYYNCSAPRVDVPHGFHIRKLDCGNDNGRRSYFVSSALYSWDRAILENSSASCERNVSIPVSRYALSIEDGSPTLEAIEKVLKDGFEVMFTTECWKCKKSYGSCGYNDSSRAFVCYCVDGPSNHTCDSGIPKKSNLTKPLSFCSSLGIGFAGGFLGATLLAGAVLCFIWRRKKLAAQNTSKGLSTTSPYSSSNTMSNTPTSTTISGSNHSLMPSISNLANGSVYFGVQVFSYEELEEATANFSRELGDGGFGTVYYGILKDGRAVAVKRLFERSLRRVEQFKNEIDILRNLKHPNLVILYGCTTRHSRELLLVYEYISNGTLADHLHGDQAQSRPICWPVRLNIAIETANALSYLHASGIIHRDVKTTNILLDSNYQVKVADFGLSRLFSTDQTHISTAPQGTPGYVDPEYYQCYRLNEKSDVYSFGVVLSELISSKEAVDITRHRHDINLANMAISKIQNDAVHELADLTLGFARDPAVKRMMMSVAELAFRCLQQEREVRPSMDEIVEVLKGIQKEGMRDFPEVVDIDVSGGDDVVLLRHGVPPPLSPVTEKETSSSNTTASSF